jgi:hypothetical protein
MHDDLAAKARLESLVGLAIRDAEATTAVRLPSRVVSRAEWELEGSILDYLALSYDEANEDVPGPGAAGDGQEDEHPPLVVDIAGTSGPCDTDRSDAELLAELAGSVQEAIIDELQRAWPVCPGHPHPAEPVVVSGAAVWACTLRSRPAVIARIGELTEG